MGSLARFSPGSRGFVAGLRPFVPLARGWLCFFLPLLLGCQILKKPLILAIEPSRGTPGTEVLIRGTHLGDPESDAEPPHLFLGTMELCFDPGNPTCPVQEWTPTQIRWVVPNVEPGDYPVYVSTVNGESNRMGFEVLPARELPIGAYVVGILDQGAEAVQWVNLKVENNEVKPDHWNREETSAEIRPYSLSLSHPGMQTELKDLLLQGNGEAFVLIAATPTDPTIPDGIHGFYHFSRNFTTPSGFVTTSTFPRNFLNFNSPLEPRDPARFGVYAEGGKSLSFFDGTERVADFSLAFLGLDFQPLGFFPVLHPSPSLLLSGEYERSGTSAIYWLTPVLENQIPVALKISAATSTAERKPLFPVLSPSGTTLYALLQGEGSSALASFSTIPLRYQGELTLPPGWQMVDLSAQNSGLWALVDQPDLQEGGLLLYLNPLSFPTSATGYESWKLEVTRSTALQGVTSPPFAEVPITHPVAFQFIPQPAPGFILVVVQSGDLYLFPQAPPFEPSPFQLLLPQVARSPKGIRWVPLPSSSPSSP